MPRVQSSSVERVDYTPESRTLDIWYTDAGRYSYSNVPESVYRALLAAPSIGRFVNAQVKDRYAFTPTPGRRKFRPD
ncbi:KTSC domain-containing protein [Allosphingosinicella flava]|uniref:KTSC domain-containing protein n=1 Tax=Allosphingosinicella flava TaxID=2771430 RepID=A0A7T2GJA4_9SPHN|nr:KTSC domain-containing protein [Sphingosinicella flava]QPQ54876.1 KTSC domain-containing protein [Sphingosinicella flava]